RIILSKNLIIKDRIVKSYRIKEIDKKIRKSRTKAEAKLLEKASKIINTPKVIEIKENKLVMEFLKGKKLSEHLDSLENKIIICKQIGKDVAKLHTNNIIHGDLTTSNMILINDTPNIFFIDFGLGFISHKLENKAVDLHLLKQALEAKHYKQWEKLWKAFEQGYKTSKEANKVLERLKAVERRGRYKEKY
ncbi:MAG: Kae1-associated serine/threonine protein kinase, partial [Nanoarchaeota archaeon]|nr:Kae1-associated serine/threonine protein kinase [Nanoarchaeota archaeon]